MLREYFMNMLRYDLWANETIADAIRPVYEQDERIIRLFCHIINAQTLWLQRIQGDDFNAIAPWDEYGYDEALERMQQTHREWLDYLSALAEEELADWISYTNTKGVAFENTVQDIVSHVLFHGMYHRAQIATRIKHHDMPPPVTDYIAYVRRT